jgi:hypothetical protein
VPIPEEPEESPFTPIEEIATTGFLIDPAKRSRAPIKPIHRYNPLKDMKVSTEIHQFLSGNNGAYNMGG